MIFHYVFPDESRNIQPFRSEFLQNILVPSFGSLPRCVCEHTNRVKVHHIRLGSTNKMNTNVISFRHLHKMFSKRVPSMYLGSPGLQYPTHNQIRPVTCDHKHHKASLNRAKVVLICKMCVVTHIRSLNNMKFTQKIIKITYK